MGRSDAGSGGNLRLQLLRGDVCMFAVRFVDEEALPADQAWVIGVDERTGDRFIFMKEGAAACPSAWEDVWRYGHVLNNAPLRVAV